MHARQGGVARDPAGRLDAVQARHPDVHEQHVRRAPLGEAHGLVSVGSLSHDLDVVLGIEQGSEPGPDEFLVVSQPESATGRSARASSVRCSTLIA